MTESNYDVAVIGAGILGLSIAYHLNQDSELDIAIIESKNSVAQGTTGFSTGGIRHTFTDPVLRTLTRRSLPFFESFDKKFETNSDFSQHGYLFVTSRKSTAQDLKEQKEILAKDGFRAEWLSAEEIAKKYPAIQTEDLIGGLLGPDDGSADPWQVAQGLYRSLQNNRHVEFQFDQSVESVQRTSSGYRLLGVDTFEVEVDQVINAAGPLLTAIESPFEAKIPLQAHNRQVCVLSSPSEVRMSGNVPLTVDKDTGFYLHPLNKHEILAGGTDKDKCQTTRPSVDRDTSMRIIDAGTQRFERFENYKLIDTYASLRGHVPDYRGFIDDLSKSENGYYVVGGFTGHGFMHAPAIGMITRDLILEGNTTLVDTEELSIKRFDNTNLNIEENTF